MGLFCPELTARPSEMTRNSSASGTIARKSGSFSGGAGPACHRPRGSRRSAFRTRAPKSVTLSAGTGRSASAGLPGKSQPAVRTIKKGHRRPALPCEIYVTTDLPVACHEVGYPIRADARRAGIWTISERSTTTRGGHAEHELRDHEPWPVNPFLEHRVDDPHEPIVVPVHTRGKTRPPQAIGAGMGGNRGVTRANKTPKPMDSTAWTAPAARNHSRWKLPSSAPLETARAGQKHPRQHIDRVPEASTAGRRPQDGRQGHRRTAESGPPPLRRRWPGSRLAPRTTAGIVMPKTS